MAQIEPSVVGTVGAVVAVVSAITGWLTARVMVDKGAAEADSVVVASAERVVGMLNAQMAQMRTEAAESQAKCQREIESLTSRVRLLEQAIGSAGLEIPPH